MDQLANENITIEIERARRRKKGLALWAGEQLLYTDYVNPLSAKERGKFVNEVVQRHPWLSDRRSWLDQLIAGHAVAQMA